MDQRPAPACGGSREPRGAGRPDTVRPRLRALRLGGAGRPAGGDPLSRIQRTPFTVRRRGAARIPGLPLVQQGIVAGVLALARTDRTFTEDEFERLGRLAESLAQTLSKLRREERLRELVYQDGETGLSNSHHFMARLEEELQRPVSPS